MFLIIEQIEDRRRPMKNLLKRCRWKSCSVCATTFHINKANVLFCWLNLQVLLATLLLLVSSPCRAAEQPPSAQWSGASDEDFKNLTVLRRHRTCVENQQYHYQGLCCLNCQAGTTSVFVLKSKDLRNITKAMSGHCKWLTFAMCLIWLSSSGTFVQKGCERDYQQGVCLPCEHGLTYTEHSNGMYRCLPCTHCREGKRLQ